jgi:predicted DNA-binding protein
MPSRKPRTALTLPDELQVTLADLADAMEKPVATVIVELLTELQPSLGDLAKFVRHAKSGKKAAAKRALSHMVGNALAEQLELMGNRK